MTGWVWWRGKKPGRVHALRFIVSFKTHTTKPAIWSFVFLLTPGPAVFLWERTRHFFYFSVLRPCCILDGRAITGSYWLSLLGLSLLPLPSSAVRAGHPGALRVRVPGSRPGRETCDGHADSQARERGPWTGKIVLWIRWPLSPASEREPEATLAKGPAEGGFADTWAICL